ncbi:N-acetyltransferase ECO1 [Hyphopichia burtonii NRRL Y-1933]|uniref:N-acetyltransferase ECO1 n=1 Tax=Hyphopichia burtonii NRRL Y-1933 TaxID=984485 RepID=A0A1E4RBH8_9ASCO|nr:N-acetyltransferase ECO1 [Hyphopichia burtonii NRRL Y-1933]ODV64622.1 N-acetyltransferase ECO1 [Hyphopichia burtonii NRRL Y-1933]
MKRSLRQLISPLLSQTDVESPSKDGNRELKRPKKVQSHLSIPSKSKSITCKVCGMCYYDYFEKDKSMHEKYHSSFINGLTWNLSDERCITTFNIDSSKGRPKSLKTLTEVRISMIDKKSSRQISKVDELLKMVNQELNALPAAEWWKMDHKDVDIQGKAFVMIIENKAIGLCIIDPIQDLEKQCRWMLYKTQKIIPQPTNKLIKVGISRIWVCHNWRRHGLALKLLETVLSNMVYGITLNKNNLGFSQPSFAGGLLAKSFNGVVHKSGETLIPVYLEE